MRRAVTALAACLVGCAGTWTSSDPLYPADWPALVASGDAQTCPDLTGTYRAVSDPAGPLEYPPGGHPREMFMFVTFGPPRPVPALGRRILSWQLAGADGPADGDLWSGLERFAAAMRADPAHPDGQDEVGWVRVSAGAAGRFDIDCGIAEDTLLTFVLGPSPAPSLWEALWFLPAHGYTTVDGAMVIHGAFPASPVESRPGPNRFAGGSFTFHRAVDGSLVMLESLHWAPAGGEVVFRKWWRWRRIG